MLVALGLLALWDMGVVWVIPRSTGMKGSLSAIIRKQGEIIAAQKTEISDLRVRIERYKDGR